MDTTLILMLLVLGFLLGVLPRGKPPTRPPADDDWLETEYLIIDPNMDGELDEPN